MRAGVKLGRDSGEGGTLLNGFKLIFKIGSKHVFKKQDKNSLIIFNLF